MTEDLRSHVENQTFADARGEVSLRQHQARVNNRDEGHDEREADHQVRPGRMMSVRQTLVEQFANEQRRHCAKRRVDDQHGEKRDHESLVGRSERDDAPDRAGASFFLVTDESWVKLRMACHVLMPCPMLILRSPDHHS